MAQCCCLSVRDRWDDFREDWKSQRVAGPPAVEFGPVLVFVLGAYTAGFLVGTRAFLVATLLVAPFSWMRHGRVPILPLFPLVLAGLRVVRRLAATGRWTTDPDRRHATRP